MLAESTFQPEYGAGTNERLLYLRCRAKGLAVTACAHALFFCKVLQNDNSFFVSLFRQEEEQLKIGIIGGGHIGKQLARVLLQLSDIPGKNIQISTRQPETLLEFQMLGIDCYYNNRQLVGWADVVFLCCLPSHLLHICSEVQDALRNCSIIYSLLTAIPLPRLKQLLSCNFILRPQYKFMESGSFSIWEANRTVVEALKDPDVIQATCPCSPKGRQILLSSVDYYSPTPIFNIFCSSSFPCFDLTTVQLKDSPLSQLLPSLQAEFCLYICYIQGVTLLTEENKICSGVLLGKEQPGSNDIPINCGNLAKVGC
uniref:NADP-dependent oxidoreductase domain-containing protein 1 n=1 Tax=Varanus komodoensis TaxID=61221 RepID=A0A8D2LMW9_VARKO